MQQQDKDIWVNEVMESLTAMQRVSVPANAYEGVMARVRNTGNLKILLPRVAAAAILLLAINIASVYHASIKKTTQQSEVYQSVNEQINNLSDGF